MALSDSEDVSFFKKSQISTDIPDITSFFEAYGVYYQENAEIGNLATTLTSRRITDADFDDLKSLTESNSVSLLYLISYSKCSHIQAPKNSYCTIYQEPAGHTLSARVG